MQCPLSQRRNADALARTNQGQLIPRRKKGKFRLVCREPYPDPWTLPSSGAVGTRLRRRACTGKEARLSARGLRDAGQEEASPCQPQGTLLASSRVPLAVLAFRLLLGVQGRAAGSAGIVLQMERPRAGASTKGVNRKRDAQRTTERPCRPGRQTVPTERAMAGRVLAGRVLAQGRAPPCTGPGSGQPGSRRPRSKSRPSTAFRSAPSTSLRSRRRSGLAARS